MTQNKAYIHYSASEIGMIWRPKWFIVTRFLAVIGVAVVLVLSSIYFRIDTVNYTALWILELILLFLNIVYVFVYESGTIAGSDDPVILENRIAVFTKCQINTDLIILTFMLHFSGGPTNPFILYYIFHTVLSAILLSRKAAYFEATFAVILFSAMTALEGLGYVKHYSLFTPGYHTEKIFIIGMILAVSSALYIVVYMASSIMDALRSHSVELEKAIDEQRRLEEEKSRFLDVVAHDLKSPLAAIETMVSTAVSVHGEKMLPAVRNILERIPKRTQGLLRFVHDLLEFSRTQKLNAMEVEYKPLNFLPIVTATVEMNMNQALDKNITVNVSSDSSIPPIQGNAKLLERMVSNLISNAIRYTKNDGEVTVTIGFENNMDILKVADTGIGIPAKSLSKIFTDFYRAENAKKFTTSGTGLGMSIIKAIVDQHKGKIAVQSEEGVGTTFIVKLPALPLNSSDPSDTRPDTPHKQFPLATS